ncbi:H-NS histone family protein [Burkholderia cenocepacia]|uniref:H-NS histone family protein n=1 Tax=Burkholderia cenocepacia TaxID=95486 RepID=UPI001F2AFDD6|nr:H-NS histone family protein [Burkholderia cenocepacia]UJH72292.1 H-NS histone family protein [Burkholderia cenocepacia]
MATSEELNARVAELEKQLEEARWAAEAQRMQERKGIINEINDLIAKHDVAADELTFPRLAKEHKSRSPKPSKGTVGQAKYRDPSSGKTWTGHGKAPAWMPADKEERKQYLINQ